MIGKWTKPWRWKKDTPGAKAFSSATSAASASRAASRTGTSSREAGGGIRRRHAVPGGARARCRVVGCYEPVGSPKALRRMCRFFGRLVTLSEWCDVIMSLGSIHLTRGESWTALGPGAREARRSPSHSRSGQRPDWCPRRVQRPPRHTATASSSTKAAT